MSDSERSSLFRRGLMMAWAMLTIFLVFALAFLLYELLNQGQAPFSFAQQPFEADDEDYAYVAPEAVQTREVPLFFAVNGDAALSAERRAIEQGDSTIENSRRVIEALAAGPEGDLQPVLPQQTQVRGLYLLDDGELVVDLSREAFQDLPRSTTAEALMVYAIVNTVTQAGVQGNQGPVRRVRFLLEGAPPHESVATHMDLGQPIQPDPGWTRPG